MQPALIFFPIIPISDTLNIMSTEEKRNQNLMNIIKKMHGFMESDDLEKQRQSQEHFAKFSLAPKGLNIEEVSFAGIYGEWLRPSRPHDARHVILYCHGGGYMTGSSAYSRNVTCKLAEAASMDVFCFNYGLAPENKYPSQLNEAMEAWNYLMLKGYGAKDIILVGDSAGGNLALALSLRLKQENRMLPLALCLYSPWTDMTASGRSYKTKKNLDPVLTYEYIKQASSRYLMGTVDNICEEEYSRLINDPSVSPLFGDFTGFPPVYIQVGTNEILYSDSEMLYKKLLSAGVTARLEAFKGMWHVFQMTPLKTAAEAIDKTAEFIFKLLLFN